MKVPCTKGYWKQQSREAHQGMRANAKEEVRKRWEKGCQKFCHAPRELQVDPHPLAVSWYCELCIPKSRRQKFLKLLTWLLIIPQSVANILARPEPLPFHVKVQPWDSSTGKEWLWEKHAWISRHAVCSPCLPLWPLLTTKKSLII